MRVAPRPLDLRLLGLIVGLAAALYLLLLCPEAYWGDSAALSSLLDSVPKPFTRSYWLYKRSALALSTLGLEPAVAANAASALFGALGVGAAGAAVFRWGGGRLGALVAAGSLAVAHTWWSMAEVAEVYTLHGLLLLGLVALAPSTGRRGLLALGLLAGLSLNHHRMILPAVVLTLGFAAWRVPGQRRTLALGLGLGALPWLFLCVRFGPWTLDPPEGVGALQLWVERALLGGRGSAAEILGTRGDLLGSLARIGRFVLLNFPGPALLLALPGARWLARRDPGGAALGLGLAMSALAMALALRWAGDAHVYLVSLHPLLAVLAGLGASAVATHRPRLAAGTGALAAIAPPVLYALLAFGPLGEVVSPSADDEARAELFWPGRAGWSEGSSWWLARSADLPDGALVVPRWREGTVLEYRQQELGFRVDLGLQLSPARPLLLESPSRATFVTWTPATAEVPTDVARLDLLLQGDQPGIRRVVLREW